VTVYAGNTIDLAEAFSVGDADNYEPALCRQRRGRVEHNRHAGRALRRLAALEAHHLQCDQHP